jgi:hypothetical protein
MIVYQKNDELEHHGIKGMRWGVRHYQNKDGSLTNVGKKREYGLSKHQAKKIIKKSGDANQQRVKKEYRSELHNNKKWNDLGKQSNKIANDFKKSEESDYIKNPDRDLLSKKTVDLYKQLRAVSNQMTRIEVDIGKKYVDKLCDAKLKDMKYSGSIEKGREMLKAYNLDYKMRYDGYIPGAYIEDDYIRPWNLD